jgi:Fe-S-cluster-containing dehydrogenase component
MDFVFANPDLCTGCKSCELACSLSHEGSCAPSLSRIQIKKWEEIAIYVPILCQHCTDAPCIPTCPTRARKRDPKTGAAITDEKWCVGCKSCIYACPYNAPVIHALTGKTISCDLCGGNSPLCVEVCSVGALLFTANGDSSSIKRRITAETLFKSGKRPH